MNKGIYGNPVGYGSMQERPLAVLQDIELFADDLFDVFVPQGWNDLVLHLVHRTNRANIADGTGIRFNADSGNNYYVEGISAVGATVGSIQTLATSSLQTGGSVGDSAPAGYFGSSEIVIPSYADATKAKTIVAKSTGPRGTGSGNIVTEVFGGFWNSLVPIYRIQLIPTAGGTLFKKGSRLTVYGQGGYQ